MNFTTKIAILALIFLSLGIVLVVLSTTDIVSGDTNQSLVRFGGIAMIILAVTGPIIATIVKPNRVR